MRIYTFSETQHGRRGGPRDVAGMAEHWPRRGTRHATHCFGATMHVASDV
jgi:hypothetical protein